ncbi:MAG: hypothetical protein J2P51_05680 [Hyphomicrobiaceae bacterium]|nr:hypothetical protein [Hyphomicrobiaceae bacterium]
MAGYSCVEASWLAEAAVLGEQSAFRAGMLQSAGLERAAQYLRSVKPEGSAVLAAQATQEGHWTFVNVAGETMTAATPQELMRVAAVLLPEAKADVKLTLYVTEDTVFEYRAALNDLPKGSEIFLVSGDESYPIQNTLGRIFAEVRPGLIFELRERKAFQEVVWQLSRPLDKGKVRVLALEPGGPPRLAASPRIDPVSRRAMVDVIDPASLPAALGAVSGQTVLVTGRLDARLLYVQPTSGAERSILLADLFRAAEDADVNLIVLRAASTPRQPGGRNWLWQKVEVTGLEQAMQHPRLADFLNALVGSNGRMLVSVTPSGGRTAIEIKPATEAAGSRPGGGIFSGIVSDVTGRVTAVGLEASVNSAERQRELDRRLVPGIPSDMQIGYVISILLGLCGLPLSRAWWRRLWPPEAASDYPGHAGYWAARTVRGAAFLLLFLPLTALVATPLYFLRQLWDAASAPARLWRRLIGRKSQMASG